MKKLLFVLPLCVLLADCSSSRKATVKPAGPGISNVNVSSNGSAPTAVTASSTSSLNRDWAYHSKYDTTLSGNWVLQGMVSSAGSWTSTVQDTAATSNATAATTTDASSMGGTSTGNTTMGSEMTTGTGTTGTSTSTAGMGTKTKTKTKTRVNSRALYDSARARLSLNTEATPYSIDSSLLQPYKYWGRTPSLMINSSARVFTGSTGCNSMSGSFNFSGNDIRFSRSINTSKMNCNDYDEATFIQQLKKVDSYTLTGDQLDLKQGNTVLLTFKRA